MSLTLVETPGASNANTYCTLAEAETVLEGRLYKDAWTAATTGNKNIALVMAARILDTAIVWTGGAKAITQSMCWPRYGMWTRNQFYITDTVIPDDLKRAQTELALQLLSTDPFTESAAVAQGVKALKVGPVQVEFDLGSAVGAGLDAMLDTVWTILPPGWGTRVNERALTVMLERV